MTDTEDLQVEKYFSLDSQKAVCLLPSRVWMTCVHGLWTHWFIARHVSIQRFDNQLHWLCGLHFCICKENPEWHGFLFLNLKLEEDLSWKADFICAVQDYYYSQDPVSFSLSDTDNKRYIYVYCRWKSTWKKLRSWKSAKYCARDWKGKIFLL